jgi:hypothetical protein
MSRISKTDKLIEISLENQKILNGIHECLMFMALRNRQMPTHDDVVNLHNSLKSLRVRIPNARADSYDSSVRAELTLIGRSMLFFGFFGEKYNLQDEELTCENDFILRNQFVRDKVLTLSFEDFIQILIDEHDYPKKLCDAAQNLETLIKKEYRDNLKSLSDPINRFLKRGKGWIKKQPLSIDNGYDNTLEQLLHILQLDHEYLLKYANFEYFHAIKAEFLQLNDEDERLAWQQRQKYAKSRYSE